MSTTPFLSEDIITLVLTWLPAKEIVRLRCVCKRWLFLTSDPRFIKGHSTHNPYPTICGFFLCDNIHNAKYFPLNANSHGVPDPTLSFLPILHNQTRISIETSCNGFIICSQAIKQSIYKSVYHVCNPTTREFAELPVPKEIDGCFSLAIDPSKSPYYKVVCIGCQIHIYSSETRSWKFFLDRKSLTEFKFRRSGRRSVYWNGVLIWIGKLCLISFDVVEECMKKLPMPPEAHQCSRGAYIGESGGKLQMIWRSRYENSTVFYISEMDSHDSLWSLLYKVDLEHVMDLYPNETQKRPICISGSRHNFRTLSVKRQGFSPVHFIRGREVGGDGMLLLNVPGKIISYNLNDKVFTKICDLSLSMGAYDCLYDWKKFHSFGHTLFSP